MSLRSGSICRIYPLRLTDDRNSIAAIAKCKTDGCSSPIPRNSGPLWLIGFDIQITADATRRCRDSSLQEPRYYVNEALKLREVTAGHEDDITTESIR